MIVCANCGKQIPTDSDFCPYCGITINRDTSETIHTEAVQESSFPNGEKSTEIFQGSIYEIAESSDSNKAAKSRKKTTWIIVPILCLILLAPSIWLYNKAAHYASPFPQLNAHCAKYISDYHNLRLGMSYSEVKAILGDSVEQEITDGNQIIIYTKDNIEMITGGSDYEACLFENNKLTMVSIVFDQWSDLLLVAKDRVDEHFSALLGDAYHKSVVGSYYDGSCFTIQIYFLDEYTDALGGKNTPIAVCFLEPYKH